MAIFKHPEDDGDLSIFASYGELLIACTGGHYWLLQLHAGEQEVLLADYSRIEAAKLDVKGEVGGGGSFGAGIPDLFDVSLPGYESPEGRRSRLEAVAKRFGPDARRALGLEAD